MRIAIYCRVSTDDQKADLQLDALHQYAEARGFTIYREYVDHISGAKVSRPALDEMIGDARRRRFDAVCVWKIDRLGRSVAHLLTVPSELQALDVAFVSLQEAIDTGTPAGRMVFTFLGAVAEFEKAIIGERVKAGMQAAKKRGKKLGRPGNGIDIKMFRKLLSEGLTVHAAALKLGIANGTAYRLSKEVRTIAEV